MKKIALILVFCLIIGVFSVGSIISPDREFSENENRNLTVFPSFTAKSVSSGNWQSKINSWYSDQLIGRDTLISLKTGLQKLCGKRDIGGVYLCDDGFYIEKKLPSQESHDIFGSNLTAVEQFFENNSSRLDKAKMTLMLVPSAAGILEDKLPLGAVTPDYETAFSTAKNLGSGEFIDLTSAMTENAEGNYYKTDHHWTTDGAYTAYKAYCKAKNLEENQFFPTVLSADFFGTTHSKVLDSSATPDRVVYYKNDRDSLYTLTADGKETDFGIYDFSRLEEKDKYAFFMGGNYGKATIKNCGGEGHLLVIKDSFANCFLPFILPDYETVTIIDPRYFVGSVDETIKTEGITEILVLYGIDSFMEEKTIPAILY